MKLKVIYLIIVNLTIFVLTKLKIKNLNQTKISPYKSNSYSIISIKTNISIPSQSCDGFIAEKVLFDVSEGIYSNFTRKIYFDGSYDNLFNTKSSSR